MNRKVFYISILVGIVLAGCSSVNSGNYGEAEGEYKKLEKIYSKLLEDEIKEKEVISLEKKYSELLESLLGKSSSKEVEALKKRITKRIEILEDLKD